MLLVLNIGSGEVVSDEEAEAGMSWKRCRLRGGTAPKDESMTGFAGAGALRCVALLVCCREMLNKVRGWQVVEARVPAG